MYPSQLRSRRYIALIVAVTFLTGCATILTHPETGAIVRCTPGYAMGGGSGALGLALISLSLILNVLNVIEHHDCIKDAQAAGYVLPKPPPEAPIKTDIQGGMTPGGRP